MIGSKIHDYRLQKKYSQGDVARAIGIPQSTLSDIEHNKYEPKLKLANRIAEFLGVSVQDLLTEQEEVTK